MEDSLVRASTVLGIIETSVDVLTDVEEFLDALTQSSRKAISELASLEPEWSSDQSLIKEMELNHTFVRDLLKALVEVSSALSKSVELH